MEWETARLIGGFRVPVDILLKEIMDANEEVVAALFIEDGQLTTWRGRDTLISRWKSMSDI